MDSRNSQDNSRVIEISTPRLPSDVAYYIAQNLIGSAFFVSKATRQPSAIISSIVIQPKIFICNIEVVDSDLEDNFDDIEYVYSKFIEVDYGYIFNHQ